MRLLQQIIYHIFPGGAGRESQKNFTRGSVAFTFFAGQPDHAHRIGAAGTPSVEGKVFSKKEETLVKDRENSYFRFSSQALALMRKSTSPR